MKIIAVFRNIAVGLLLVLGCHEMEHGPLLDGIGSPSQLRNIQVESLPGAAKISYALPDDEGFLYVVAEYMDERGRKKTVKASNFRNFVLLEGFAQESEVEVSLYTVSRSEERSNPTNVVIQPLKASIHHVFETLDAVKTFGGAAVSFHNESENEFVVHTLYKNEEQEWEEYDRFYSSAKENQYAVRGFAPEPTEFAFYLTDKWGNNSDTLYRELTPLYEEELDKSLWQDAALLDDFNEPLYSPLYQLWTPGATTYFFQDYRKYPEKAVMPNWITIDFGKEYILGRMKVNQVSHSDTWKFSSCSPRNFEIWATNNPSTDWNDWTLLGQFESIKPSGLPGGQLSDDDRRVNAEGEEFDMPISSESYRYIRFRTTKTWGGVSYMCALELTFWGQAVNNQ